MGAAPVRPPIPGYDRVRTLRTVEDAARLAADVDVAPSTAVVIGAGFIGLEMAENLVGQGIDVTIVEATPQVLPPLDPELAILVADELVAHGVHVETGATVASVEDSTVTLADGRVLAADLVVGAIGVRPDVQLAEAAGLELGTERWSCRQRGEPDERSGCLRSWRCGGEARRDLARDVAHRPRERRQSPGSKGGRPHRRPTVARRSRRSGTAIVKVFDLVAATVGWSERRLRAAGRPFRAIHSHPFDHATYYPGATRMAAKLIFDPNDGTILGAQIVGRNGVDKRIDVIATAMAGGHHRRPPRGPRTGVRAAVLVGQGSREPARLHGRERAERRLRRRRRTRAGRARRAGAGPSSTCAPQRSTPTARSRDRSTYRSTRSVTSSTRSAIARSSSTARSVNEDTLRPHSCTSSGCQARNLDGGYRTWTASTRAQTER